MTSSFPEYYSYVIFERKPFLEGDMFWKMKDRFEESLVVISIEIIKLITRYKITQEKRQVFEWEHG
jgi:hypothetical protein